MCSGMVVGWVSDGRWFVATVLRLLRRSCCESRRAGVVPVAGFVFDWGMEMMERPLNAALILFMS